MLATNDNARDNDRESTSRPPESGVKPLLRFDEWDDEAFEAWESSFDRAYLPPSPAPAPSEPALQAEADAASEAEAPVAEELAEKLEAPQPPPEVESPAASFTPTIPPPPSTLRGLAPSQPPFVPSVDRMPSIVSTDKWPALSPESAEEITSITETSSTSFSVPPVVLAAEPEVEPEPEAPSTSERPAPHARVARARRLRAWMLAAAAVLVAPGLAGLFLTAAPQGGAARAARAVEETVTPLQAEARQHTPRPAKPAKAKPGRRWSSKQRRR